MFRWTPGFVQAGTYTVDFFAMDDGNGTGTPLGAAISVPIVVGNANRAPVLPVIDNVSIAKGAVQELDVTAVDPDGNPVVYSTLDLPRFASLIHNGDGTTTLRIAPGDNDRGDYVVTLKASDDGDGGGTRKVLTASRTLRHLRRVAVRTAGARAGRRQGRRGRTGADLHAARVRSRPGPAHLHRDRPAGRRDVRERRAVRLQGVHVDADRGRSRHAQHHVPRDRQRQQRRRPGGLRRRDHHAAGAHQQCRAGAPAGGRPRGRRGRHAVGAAQGGRHRRRSGHLLRGQPAARRDARRPHRPAQLDAESLPGGHATPASPSPHPTAPAAAPRRSRSPSPRPTRRRSSRAFRRSAARSGRWSRSTSSVPIRTARRSSTPRSRRCPTAASSTPRTAASNGRRATTRPAPTRSSSPPAIRPARATRSTWSCASPT